MKIKYFLPLITAFLMVFSGFQAKAESITKAAAQEWAQHKGREILHILAQKEIRQKFAALDEIFYNDVDLDHAAKFVVGRYWKLMTKEQQAVYVPLFKRYTAGLYKAYPLDIPQGSIDYEISKVLPSADKTDVFCLIKVKQKEASSDKAENNFLTVGVVFTLVKNNNRIQVRDLKIGESSLLISFRDRFTKMIHVDNDDEIAWFLEDLQDITESDEQDIAQMLEHE